MTKEKKSRQKTHTHTKSRCKAQIERKATELDISTQIHKNGMTRLLS